mmetsp:Transcript_44136/g.133761  ORF Transcript_44136/g.133761 Transcript_44136/m.133761 type:complete len:326 (+) Transcript_44136:873-1850(+)
MNAKVGECASRLYWVCGRACLHPITNACHCLHDAPIKWIQISGGEPENIQRGGRRLVHQLDAQHRHFITKAHGKLRNCADVVLLQSPEAPRHQLVGVKCAESCDGVPIEADNVQGELFKHGEARDGCVRHCPSRRPVLDRHAAAPHRKTVIILVHVQNHAHVLLLRPRHDLLDAVQVHRRIGARRGLQHAPRNRQAHDIKSQLPNLRQVVAGVWGSRLAELPPSSLAAADRRVRVSGLGRGAAAGRVEGWIDGAVVLRRRWQGNHREVYPTKKHLPAALVHEHPPRSSPSRNWVAVCYPDPPVLCDGPSCRAMVEQNTGHQDAQR